MPRIFAPIPDRKRQNAAISGSFAAPFITVVPFALTAVPHSKFGEALTLLIRQDMPDKDRLQCEIAQVLPKYQQPKYILFVDGIPLTETGKISRAECKRIALRELKIETE